MKVYELHLEHHDAHVCLVIGGEVADFRSFLKGRYSGKLPKMYSWDKRVPAKTLNNTDAFQMHVNYEPPLYEEIFYLWIAEGKNFAHEYIHIVNDILFRVGLEYSWQSEEEWGYLGNEVYNKLMKLILGEEKFNQLMEWINADKN